jgi:hypothetical protein
MRVRRWFLAVLTLVAVASAGTAYAQGTTSRLVGTVSDTTGAVIPGATVTLTNEGTGVSFTTATTAAGTYTFEALQVGSYTVTVELSGFKKFVSTGNRVTIGQPATVNATLEQGTVVETVTVSASAETVQLSTSGNIGTLFEQKTLEALPIVVSRGRNPLTLVTTQPGVVSGANTGGGTHVHGARDRAWNFTLDGIDTNESSAGGSNFSPLRTNPDSLAEFRILTGNFTAELGRNSGGQVAMVTRSGTNDLHGTGFYFHRRPDWNANEWENNIDRLPKAQFFQHISGFSLGGPILRNRTFYFANMQVLRAKFTRERTRTVLTQSARQGLWRFVVGGRNQPAGSPTASIDASGNVLGGVNVGTYSIPANDPQRLGLDPTTQALIGKTPLPNNFTVGDGLNTAGFTFTPEEQERQHDFVVKVDHVFSNRHNVFGRVAWGRQDTVCDQVNGGDPPFPGLPCLVDTERDPVNTAFSWRWNPSGSVVNEVVVGNNHFTFDFVNPSADPSKPTYTLPLITAPEDFTFGNARSIDTFQFVDNLSWVRGSHSLKFGTNIRLQRHLDERGSVAGFNVHPIVNFSTATNTVDPATFGIPGTINTTFDRPNLQSAINLLLGRVGSFNQGFVQQGDTYGPGGTLFEFDARYPELDFYAQDNWKLRPNLTIDAGVRWELKMAPSNPDNLIRRPNQRVAVGAQPTNTLRWEEGKLYDDDVNNIGPSIGVAWDPTGNGKQAVRANYRLAYDRINTFVLSSTIFQSIPGITKGETNTAFGQAGGRLRQSLPSLAPTARPNDFLQPPAASNNLLTVVDTEFESPMTHGWILSYQRELWKNTLLDVTYVGRDASNLFGSYDINQVLLRESGFLDAFNIVRGGGESDLINRLLLPDTRRNAGESGSQMVRRLFASSLTLNSAATVAADIAKRVQGGRTVPELAGFGSFFLTPFPQFLGSAAGNAGLRVLESNGWSDYHGLELQLERRFSNGLGYTLGYTLSRSRDTGSYDPAFTVVSGGANQSASSTPFDIYNRDLNYAVSDFDRTHVLNGFVVVELPFGRGKRFAADAGPMLDRIINGWNIATAFQISSGRPFTVYSGANTLSNIVQTPANCSGCDGGDGTVFDDPSITPVVKWYFNADERARFSGPAAGQFSDIGRNAFRGDGVVNVNMALMKRVRTVGSHQFEFRLEATNVLNVPSFGFPTATTTSSIFGRIRNSVVSTARQVQMGIKYYF